MHVKYKAVDWESIYGQDHIKNIVFNMDLAGRCFLFVGEKGTGKSQMAIILAKSFGCSDNNIISIDCVHYGESAKAMREVLASLTEPSILNDNQALILDEPQELSHKAQETLLNPALNLPNNKIIIACSAKPEKFEEMAADRFYILRTRALDSETSLNFLNTILYKEGLKLDKAKKAAILSSALGNPRRILKAIPIVANTHLIKDINYLLTTSIMEDIAGESSELFRLLLSSTQYDLSILIKQIHKILKTKTPLTIRVDLINLISYRLCSGNINAATQAKLFRMSDLLNNNNFPEKAYLIIDLCKIYTGN